MNATIATQAPSATLPRDERFFLIMAIVMAAVTAAGFSVNVALGRSSFAAPLLLHVHALVFFGWVALYLAQTFLAARGSLALHRRLGWLSLVWMPAMVVIALLVVRDSVQSRGGPPFFALNEFLIGNTLALLCFAGLVAAGVVNRRRTAWHRRLMFCSMAMLTGPGWGRLLPTPLFIPWSWWVVGFAAPAIFPLIGIVADRRRGRRVHPAWWWGLGAMVATHVVAQVIAFSPLGLAITHWVVDGTPGGARDFAPHFP